MKVERNSNERTELVRFKLEFGKEEVKGKMQKIKMPCM